MAEKENGKFQPCAEFNKFLCSSMKLCTEMCHQRHFAHCSDRELAACRDELPNAGLLLTLSNFLAAVFFVQWVRKLVRQFPCSSSFVFLQCNLNLLQHTLFIGTIIMLIWPHANQCWTWLVFMLLHMYLKGTAVKWYTTSFSFSKSPLGWIYRAPMQAAAEE